VASWYSEAEGGGTIAPLNFGLSENLLFVNNFRSKMQNLRLINPHFEKMKIFDEKIFDGGVKI